MTHDTKKKRFANNDEVKQNAEGIKQYQGWRVSIHRENNETSVLGQEYFERDWSEL